MADLFISYAREDSARASAIASALEADGFSVFWDSEIPAGQTWADFIETKLRNSAAVLVLWSAHSIQSQWVREEARMGRDAGKLIPVQLDASMPPFGFGEVQAANLQTWTGDRADAGWQRLVGAIRFAIEKNGQTPPPPRPVTASPPPAPPPPAQPAFAAATPSSAAAPAAAPSKIKPIWLIGAGGLALVGLIAVLVGINGGLGGSQQSYDDGGVSYSQAEATALTASVQEAVDAALQAETEAAEAASEAAGHYENGAAAANAAFAGQVGYGSQQAPDGTMVAGELAAMAGGQVAAVGIASPNGIQFYGYYQQSTATDYSMSGRASVGGGLADGSWIYTASTYTFSGVVSVQGRYAVSAQEQGPSNGMGGTGIGVITYPDGSRYVGEYRSVGSFDQVQYLREGLGAFYAATGELLESGRYANDAWASEE